MNIIDQFLTALKAKQVILYSTDTIWGLGGDATDEQVIARILAIKGRGPNKSLISLMHPSFIAEYTNSNADGLLDAYSRQLTPTTFIIPYPKNLPDGMIMNNTIAARIPFGCPYLMEVLEKFGKPIISTSANISDNPYPIVFDDIVQEIKDGVDYIVPAYLDTGTHKPSTIVSYNDNTQFR